jgi:hypothetical protein
MSMPSVTRLIGFLLIALGLVAYVATGAASITALIPAIVGAVFLLLALAARSAAARRHAMHAAVALALVLIVGLAPRVVRAIGAGEIGRPAVLAQIAMLGLLLVHLVLGVKSFVDARRAR